MILGAFFLGVHFGPQNFFEKFLAKACPKGAIIIWVPKSSKILLWYDDRQTGR